MIETGFIPSTRNCFYHIISALSQHLSRGRSSTQATLINISAVFCSIHFLFISKHFYSSCSHSSSLQRFHSTSQLLLFLIFPFPAHLFLFFSLKTYHELQAHFHFHHSEPLRLVHRHFQHPAAPRQAWPQRFQPEGVFSIILRHTKACSEASQLCPQEGRSVPGSQDEPANVHFLVLGHWAASPEKTWGWKYAPETAHVHCNGPVDRKDDRMNSMFRLVFVDNKLYKGCCTGASCIRKAPETQIVKSSLAKALSQPTPFEVRMFFHFYIFVEDRIANKLDLLCIATWGSCASVCCSAFGDSLECTYYARRVVERADRITFLHFIQKQNSDVQGMWKSRPLIPGQMTLDKDSFNVHQDQADP